MNFRRLLRTSYAIICIQRVATAKIYTTKLSYYSPGVKSLDRQKAEKEVGDDLSERKREGERERESAGMLPEPYSPLASLSSKK